MAGVNLELLVAELVDFRRTGFLEALERGHSIVGDVSATPAAGDVELRAGASTLTVSLTALRNAIDTTEAARTTSRRLFIAEPVGPRPDPAEEQMVRELEQSLAALDAIGDDEAAASAKRRFVLDDLDFYGILALRGHEARGFWLERWDLPHVLDWQRAALAAWTYYLGDARAKAFVKPLVPARLIDGPFALDWFRRPPQVPATWTADRLSIVAESTFERTFANPDRAQGTYFYSSGRIRGQFWFRTDFAKVCLYAANVSVG